MKAIGGVCPIIAAPFTAQGDLDADSFQSLVRHLVRAGANALTLAVLGAPDIDRFTFGDCQGPTIRVLITRVPDLKLGGSPRAMRAIAAAKLKGCAGLSRLLGAQYP